MRHRNLAIAALLSTTVFAACGEEKGGKEGSFCDTIRKVDALDSELDSAFGPDATPADLEKTFDTYSAALSELRSEAPDELKADVETVSDAFGDFIEVLESADYDLIALSTDPDAAASLEALDSDAVNEAGDRLDAYTEDVCGLEVES